MILKPCTVLIRKHSKKQIFETFDGQNKFDDTASNLSRLTELEDKQKHAQYLERRARAHEKLLLFAYSALSVPPSNGMI